MFSIFLRRRMQCPEGIWRPEEEEGWCKEDVKEVAHKVAWAAVKKDYKKNGDE